MGGKQSKNTTAAGSIVGSPRLFRRNSSSSKKKCPKPRSRSTSVDSGSTSTPEEWLYEGVEIGKAYDLHETIAYGTLGTIRVCCKHKRQFSNHHGIVTEEWMFHSDRTATAECEEKQSKRTHHRLYACKEVCLSRIIDKKQLLKDVTKLHDLQHPNLLQVNKVFCGKRHIWLVTELCTGGDLYARLAQNTELDVVDILEQLIQVLGYMHQQQMVHGSIQLENVLYDHAGSNAGIKLCDFNISQVHGRVKTLNRVCNNVYATAPEVLLGESPSPASDVYSIGVVAYCLLSGGSFPFGPTASELDMERLKAAQYTFDAFIDKSDSAKEFCSKSLCRKHDRWTTQEALAFVREAWMPALETSLTEEQHDDGGGSIPLTLRGLHDFGLHGELHKRILMTMANTLSKTSLEELKEIFRKLDSNQSGTLTLLEVEEAVLEFRTVKGDESELIQEDIKEMFQSNDTDRTRTIHYVDFMDAVLEAQGMMTQERLGEAFDDADEDQRGRLSKEKMKEILGPDCDGDFVDGVLAKADPQDTGQVDYDEFLRLVFEDPGKAMNHVSRVVDPP